MPWYIILAKQMDDVIKTTTNILRKKLNIKTYNILLDLHRLQYYIISTDQRGLLGDKENITR